MGALGEQTRALLGQQRAARAAENARGLGGEVPTAGEQLLRGPVGDRAAVRQKDRTLRASGCELGIVRGDDHRLALSGAPAQLERELGLGLAVHPARGLIQRQHRRRLALPGDDRQSQPLTLAPGEIAGVALAHLL